ncbi:unnamed protein product (macronuclear) [Paramecium tetraurelia]|uniref:cyclin-dependent kinase n=1 Tax=Paramecium tetraurelia TaxID=5888 RepID=A0CSE1_PARTE|nr:uncharacterized protein GSPATT00009980001 [Paramecium tetraurelia]CAK73708.1 unnamed protein product [Paramecium tetraurelia]|eukprot:XP_001441105.1 hypothetical protein (macronuclear) [Paramecium tetraurelia strain d4-2]
MNKYEIMGVVGEGAYGIVLKCKNKETNECVAIKKFKETEDDEAVKKSIQREVKMLRMLKHPNIIQLKEAFKKKGKIFLVFQFVDRNLLELLEERKTLDQECIKRVIFQLVLAVHACHSVGIAHRDIKPENLLIDNDLNLKLCDFGFARTIQSQEQLTDYVATRWYRSPELLISNNYGKQVDIWAIGCIMGELIDGQPLFPGENEMDQLYLIQKIIGPLTQDQMEKFQKNQRYIGMKFPEIVKSETIEKRYSGKMCNKGLNFLKQCLLMDPNKRLTSQDCLEHPYLSDLWSKESEIRPKSNFQRRISCERDDSKHSILNQYDFGEQKPKKIQEKAIPQTIQNQSFVQRQVYNYKIGDETTEVTKEDDTKSQMHKTFNQSFKIKFNDTLPQSRLGSEQDKRINRIIGLPGLKEDPKQQQQQQQAIHNKSPNKRTSIQQPSFYVQGQYNLQPQKLNLVYNANTYNYSIKKSYISKK